MVVRIYLPPTILEALRPTLRATCAVTNVPGSLAPPPARWFTVRIHGTQDRAELIAVIYSSKRVQSKTSKGNGFGGNKVQRGSGPAPESSPAQHTFHSQTTSCSNTCEVLPTGHSGCSLHTPGPEFLFETSLI